MELLKHPKVRGRSISRFQRDVLKTIARAWASGACSFSSLAEKSEGLWPAELGSFINLMEVPVELGSLESAPREYPDWPEPHPALYEWRFARNSAKEIAEIAVGLSGSIVCVGCPTVFHSLNLAGVKSVLLDVNPILTNYFCNFWPGSEIHRIDLTNPLPVSLRGRFDVIVGDPPWYLDHILLWTQRAIELSSGPSAKLLFPLLQKLTRPKAKSEIAYLIQWLRKFGPTHILNTKAVYETPRFEIEAIATWGHPAPPFWRRGQWVLVNLHNRLSVVARPPPRINWTFHKFGSEVVAVRDSIPPGKPNLRPLGTGILRSPSSRDPLRPEIDVWTSRNRVFRATGGESLLELIIRAAAAFREGARTHAADVGTTMLLYGVAGLEEICRGH